MASGTIKKTFRTIELATSNITYTANTEVSGTYDFTSSIPPGYEAVGVIGYNAAIARAYIRRIYIPDNDHNVVYYSITSPTSNTQPLRVVLLLQPK